MMYINNACRSASPMELEFDDSLSAECFIKADRARIVPTDLLAKLMTLLERYPVAFSSGWELELVLRDFVAFDQSSEPVFSTGQPCVCKIRITHMSASLAAIGADITRSRCG